MPTKKLSELSELAEGPAGTDELYINDGGVSKRITHTNLTTVTATGSTTARSLAERFADIVNVKDYGAAMDGSTDDLAKLNLGIADLNSGAIRHLKIPAGVMVLSAEPDTITAAGNWAISGDGPGATAIKFNSAAGTAGTFFTVGDASNTPINGRISNLRLECANTATLDGTTNVFDIQAATDLWIANIKCVNVNGFIRLGSSTKNVSRVRIDNVDGTVYGPASGFIVDIEQTSGLRVRNFRWGMSAADDGVKGIYIHPTSNNVVDSCKWNVEFNFPDFNPDNIVDIDATNGIIVNQWFDSCVFDHSDVAGVKLHIDGSPSASARISNIWLTNCRVTMRTSGVPLTLDNTGVKRFEDINVLGGIYIAVSATKCVSIPATAANTDIEVRFIGVEFLDQDYVTGKVGIETGSPGPLIVQGCAARPFNSDNANSFTHLVKFLANTSPFVITGNDCATVTTAVADTALLTQGQQNLKIIRDNLSANHEHTAKVQTTDATATTMATADLADERTYHVRAIVTGVKSDGTDRASYELVGTFYRTGGGNAVLEGAITTVHSVESNASWNAALQINLSTVRVRITGVAATTINWGCSLEIIGVA